MMRLPRCHEAAPERSGFAALQCDRKDQHKGFHRSTVLMYDGTHVDVKWGHYEE